MLKLGTAGMSTDLMIKDSNLGKGKHREKEWHSGTQHIDIHQNAI